MPPQMMDLALRHGPYGDKSERKLSPALEDYPHGLDLGPLAEPGAALENAEQAHPGRAG